MLFSGTIRTNLDPTNSYSDTEIADVLSKLHLINSRHQNAVNNRPQFPNPDNPFSDLQTPISPLGTSLSPGQRQLVTIARTLLSHPKLVIFDEATSAIDVATDTLVQQSLRECFNNSTLIVIAHRLSTIYDFDQVLVLDGGRVAEYGRPAELRAREGSLFQKLCKSSKGIK